jgi:hypothetical protein
MTAPADQMIAELQARGFTIERASGGPVPESEADRHAAAGLKLEASGPQILRVSSDTIDVTVPATADALGEILANCDAAEQRSES